MKRSIQKAMRSLGKKRKERTKISEVRSDYVNRKMQGQAMQMGEFMNKSRRRVKRWIVTYGSVGVRKKEEREVRLDEVNRDR